MVEQAGLTSLDELTGMALLQAVFHLQQYVAHDIFQGFQRDWKCLEYLEA